MNFVWFVFQTIFSAAVVHGVRRYYRFLYMDRSMGHSKGRSMDCTTALRTDRIHPLHRTLLRSFQACRTDESVSETVPGMWCRLRFAVIPARRIPWKARKAVPARQFSSHMLRITKIKNKNQTRP